MAFEGVEKKVEILVEGGAANLRGRGQAYWREIVAASRAEVLSVTSNQYCDAYLLSESSLFVYDDRMIMITCGQTRLVLAVERLLQDLPVEHIQSLIYERKNELYPGKQATTFQEDVDRLQTLAEGESHVFGNPDRHHLSLFHLNKPFRPDPEDLTTELLMYDLAPAVYSFFRPGYAGASPQELLGLGRIFPEFTWDDHLFEPAGYSLNGIHEDTYITVHITPDTPGSYASLETNGALTSKPWGIAAETVLGLLKPARFDLICFEEDPEPLALASGLGALQDEDSRRLPCGYPLHFFHYQAQGR